MEKEINNYNCQLCGKVFKYKSLLLKHIDKKIPCCDEEKKAKNKEKRTCVHCNKEFTRLDSLKDHLMICRTKMIKDKEIEFSSKQNNKDNDIKKEVEFIKKQLSIITEEKDATIYELKQIIEKLRTDKGILFKDDKNIVINDTNAGNNIVKILPYGEEDLSFITDDNYKIMLNRGFNSVHYFVEYVHFNKNKPENQNIRINNIRDKYVLIFDGDKWILKDRDDMFQEIIETKINLLWIKYFQLKNSLDEYTKHRFNCFLEKQYDDEIIEYIKNDLKLMLYNKKLINELPKIIS